VNDQNPPSNPRNILPTMHCCIFSIIILQTLQCNNRCLTKQIIIKQLIYLLHIMVVSTYSIAGTIKLLPPKHRLWWIKPPVKSTLNAISARTTSSQGYISFNYFSYYQSYATIKFVNTLRLNRIPKIFYIFPLTLTDHSVQLLPEVCCYSSQAMPILNLLNILEIFHEYLWPCTTQQACLV
jgi:hypothetical protein